MIRDMVSYEVCTERALPQTGGRTGTHRAQGKGAALKGQQGVGWYLHGDLISCISPHHVLDDEPASRMMIEPAIEAEDQALIDDNGVASSDQGGDVVPGEDFGLVHGEGWLEGDADCN